MTDNQDIIDELRAVNEKLEKLQPKRHGLGILDWLKGSLIYRSLEILGTIAIIFGVSTFMMNMEDVKHDRDARAWRLLATEAPGNSGKIEALEYLNKHNPLELVLPNPRRWGMPLGPKAKNDGDKLPKNLVEITLVQNYGPWKSRTTLQGIDLSRKRKEDAPKDRIPFHYDVYWAEPGKYLQGVQLPYAQLTDANLTGADLEKANLVGAYLVGIKLTGANLVGADLTSAFLASADLSGAFLLEANLTGANFREANLTGADLHEANLTGAFLGNADLVRADLSGAFLGTTDLSGADLREATLKAAKNLTQDQIDKTCAEEAKLPDGLVPPTPCKRNKRGKPIRDADGNPIRLTEEEANQRDTEIPSEDKVENPE